MTVRATDVHERPSLDMSLASFSQTGRPIQRSGLSLPSGGTGMPLERLGAVAVLRWDSGDAEHGCQDQVSACPPSRDAPRRCNAAELGGRRLYQSPVAQVIISAGLADTVPRPPRRIRPARHSPKPSGTTLPAQGSTHARHAPSSPSAAFPWLRTPCQKRINSNCTLKYPPGREDRWLSTADSHVGGRLFAPPLDFRVHRSVFGGTSHDRKTRHSCIA